MTAKPPKTEQFESLLRHAHKEAKKAGIKKSDVKAAITKVRRRGRRDLGNRSTKA